GVRVPQRNPLVWRYARLDAGEGAMVWRDEHGEIAAFNVAHQAGGEGWMGPLAVRPDRQSTGVGKTIVRTAADWLIDRGITTLGLETMPRTPENIGFYARLGFAPGFLTVTLTNEIATRGHPAPVLLSRRPAAAKAGIRRIAVRCQSRYAEAFRRLIARGYRVRWTYLRMTYERYAERHAAQGVLFSNWEI